MVPLPDNTTLTKVLSVLDGGNLFHTLYPKVFAKFEFVVDQKLFYVKFCTFVQILVKELALLIFIKYVTDLPIKDFLNQFDLVLLLEAVEIDAPVLELYLKHFYVFLLFLVKLATISDEIDHHGECLGIPINKIFLFFFLNRMTATEHCLKCAALYLAQRRFSYIELFFPTHI